MEITTAGKIAAAYATPQQRPDVTPPKPLPRDGAAQDSPNPNSRINSPATQQDDQVSLAASITRKNLATVKAIESMHAKMDQLVKGVRATTESLGNAVGQIEQSKGTLAGITKNYPPFPIDSSERKEILMSYASIRKEIIRMEIPPPPPPIYEKVKGIWEPLFSSDNRLRPATIAELEPESSDRSVKAAVRTLDSTMDALATISSRVAQALVQP